MKKILLALGTLTMVAAPIATTIACGASKKTHTKIEKPDEKNAENDKTNENIQLDDWKKKEIVKINSQAELTNDEKTELLAKVESIKSMKDTNLVDEEFLNFLKIKIIDGLPADGSLSPDEVESFAERINLLKTSEGLQKEKESVELLIDAKLTSYKAKMVEMVLGEKNPLDIMDNGDVNTLVKEINKADSTSKIDELFFKAFQENRKLFFDKFPELSNTEKNNWMSQIDEDDTQLNVEKDINYFKYLILDKTRTDVTKLILANKESEKETILDDKQKNEFLEKVSLPQTVEELNNLKTEILLRQAKNIAIDKLHDLRHSMSDDEIIDYNNEINGDDSISQIDSQMNALEFKIFDEFQSSSSGNVGLYFSVDYRAKIWAELDEATTVSQIKRIFETNFFIRDKNNAENLIKSSNDLISNEVSGWLARLGEAKTRSDISITMENLELFISKRKAVNKINSFDQLDSKELWITEINLDLSMEQVKWSLKNLDIYLNKGNFVKNEWQKLMPTNKL